MLPFPALAPTSARGRRACDAQSRGPPADPRALAAAQSADTALSRVVLPVPDNTELMYLNDASLLWPACRYMTTKSIRTPATF